jgi:hypothetical protein
MASGTELYGKFIKYFVYFQSHKIGKKHVSKDIQNRAGRVCTWMPEMFFRRVQMNQHGLVTQVPTPVATMDKDHKHQTAEQP